MPVSKVYYKGVSFSTAIQCIYVSELSELLNKSDIGRNMGSAIINHMLYADDICIVSLSPSRLQQVLKI